MNDKQFTHIDDAGNPRMVDVSGKHATRREARARGSIKLGSQIMAHLNSERELITRKGPVFQTAIIAGVMAAKNTAMLIPFCHPIAIEDCKILIEPDAEGVVIESSVVVTGKTGVEMEALTAVSIAALTVYDMCKALSHDIEIGPVALIEKTGGKRDYRRPQV